MPRLHVFTLRASMALWTLLAVACVGPGDATPESAPDPEVTSDAADATSAAGGGVVVPGTPAGGLEDWVSQIARGLDVLVEQLESDVQAAQQTALDLYVTRQEYIEMYWGVPGQLRGEGTGALSVLVLQAEAAFHDLLRALAVEPVDAGEVVAITDTINARLELAVAEAKARGVPLTPPGNPAAVPATSGP